MQSEDLDKKPNKKASHGIAKLKPQALLVIGVALVMGIAFLAGEALKPSRNTQTAQSEAKKPKPPPRAKAADCGKCPSGCGCNASGQCKNNCAGMGNKDSNNQKGCTDNGGFWCTGMVDDNGRNIGGFCAPKGYKCYQAALDKGVNLKSIDYYQQPTLPMEKNANTGNTQPVSPLPTATPLPTETPFPTPTPTLAPPQELSFECGIDDPESVILNWTPTQEAGYHTVFVTDISNPDSLTKCTATGGTWSVTGDQCFRVSDAKAILPVISGHTYNWWVNSCRDPGNCTEPVFGSQISCEAPPVF